jgi:hypothetical protein
MPSTSDAENAFVHWSRTARASSFGPAYAGEASDESRARAGKAMRICFLLQSGRRTAAGRLVDVTALRATYSMASKVHEEVGSRAARA